jgi:hypothetical protein
MAFATEDDVVADLGRQLTPAEGNRVDSLLDQATDLVIGYLGGEPNPVPGAVVRVVATMVAAVFTKPAITVADYDASGYSTARESAGVHIGTESATSEGPWLTNSLKMRLNPYRGGAVVVYTMASEYGS